MKIYDISLTITPDLPVWPGDMKVQLERTKKMEEGAHDNLSRIAMGVHTGTHMDAPYHFVMDGKKIDELPIDRFIGPVQVVELDEKVDLITSEIVNTCGIHAGMEKVLFKTRNSGYWARGEKRFIKEFVGISPDGAQALIQKEMKFVGIDYLSVAPFGNSVPTHVALLGADMVLLEGANLSEVPAGEYTLYCLPIKLGGSEGAPARAILLKD